jgi:carbon starvation protein
MVGGWGWFLIQGVRDPLGGINSLWPLFGIANQLLSAIALCLATTILLKMQLGRGGRKRVMLVTLVPLVWLLSVTMTAGWQKIFHADPRIGFLSQARTLDGKRPALEMAAATGDAVAIKELRANRAQHFNQRLDAVVAGVFLSLVMIIVLLSLREWLLLILRKRLADLRESEAVWLPESALATEKLPGLLGLFMLSLAMARELSGEAALARATQNPAKFCECAQPTQQQLYIAVTNRRFNRINRCC